MGLDPNLVLAALEDPNLIIAALEDARGLAAGASAALATPSSLLLFSSLTCRLLVVQGFGKCGAGGAL